MDLSEDEGWREGPNVRTCRPYARLPTPREAMRELSKSGVWHAPGL